MEPRKPSTPAPVPEAPPDRSQRRAALAAAALLLAAALGLAPLAGTPLPLPPGFIAGHAALLLTLNTLLALLAWQRGVATHQASTLSVAAALLFTAVMLLPRLVLQAMPPASLAVMWQIGFGALMLHGALALRRERAQQQQDGEDAALAPVLRPGLLLAGVLLLAAALIALAQLLPPLTGRWTPPGVLALMLNLGALALTVVPPLRQGGLAALATERLWFAVALLAAVVQVWLSLFQGGEPAALGTYLRAGCGAITALALAVPLLTDIAALHRRVRHADALVASLADQDGLTGLANRRRFDKVLAAEWARSFRAEQPLALLRIDVDHQQRFNERYGPEDGDELLRRLGALLAATCNRRAGDLCARINGDEFAVVLPDTDIAGAAVMAALVRRELAELAIAHADSPTGLVTVSIGIAPTQARQTGPQDLLHAADDALFRAKADGRDQASLAPRQDDAASSEQWAAAQGLVQPDGH